MEGINRQDIVDIYLSAKFGANLAWRLPRELVLHVTDWRPMLRHNISAGIGQETSTFYSISQEKILNSKDWLHVCFLYILQLEDTKIS